jgi:hypothetical protein
LPITANDEPALLRAWATPTSRREGEGFFFPPDTGRITSQIKGTVSPDIAFSFRFLKIMSMLFSEGLLVF